MMMTTMMGRVRFRAVALTPSAPFAFCVGVERYENKDSQNKHDSRHFKLLQAIRKMAGNQSGPEHQWLRLTRKAFLAI
jgi:hypothetical protein